MSNKELYEITFSREKPAAWPPLHLARIDADRTLCGIKLTGEWDYDGECGPGDVECQRYKTIMERISK